MNRRTFVTGLGAALATPIAAEAQRAPELKTDLGLTIPPSLLLRGISH